MTNAVVDNSAAGTLADRGRRLVAQILDGLCVLPGVALLFASASGPGSDGKSLESAPIGIVAIGVVGLAYVVGFLGIQMYLLSTLGQTVGKRWMAIKIEMVDGTPVGFVHVVFVRLLVNGFFGNVPFLGWLYFLVDNLMIFRADRRCVHDRIAGTRVVRA